LAVASLVAGVGISTWVAIEAAAIPASTGPLCHSRLGDVPHRRVGLLLGCSNRLPGGRTNLYYLGRIEAATELWSTGTVDYILVSGDNHSRDYDEPTTMLRDLVIAGVPRERIVLDYAGFRTLDSVVRAKEVFGLDGFVVISQRFHNERAVFIARANGLDAVAYDAADVAGADGRKTHAREFLARLRAVLDVELLGTRPHFLGDRIPIGDGA
jgi:SanA protein